MGHMAMVMLLAMGAVSPRAGAVEKAGKALEGTWKLMRVEGAEREALQRWLDNGATLTFRAGILTLSISGYDTELGSYKLERMNSTEHLDLMLVGHPSTGKTVRAIYKVEGDVLTLCYAEPGKPRPRKFTCRNGDAVGLLTLKRQKT